LRTALLVLFMMAVCAGVGLLTVSLPRRPPGQTVEKGAEPKQRNKPTPSPPTPQSLTYEKDILPIMRRSCNRCHAGKTRRGGVDLSSLASLRRGGDGGPVVKPGKPKDSSLYETIINGRMPPKKPQEVSQQERELVRAWIEAGAK
jgi:hypothetical protein